MEIFGWICLAVVAIAMAAGWALRRRTPEPEQPSLADLEQAAGIGDYGVAETDALIARLGEELLTPEERSARGARTLVEGTIQAPRTITASEIRSEGWWFERETVRSWDGTVVREVLAPSGSGVDDDPDPFTWFDDDEEA